MNTRVNFHIVLEGRQKNSPQFLLDRSEVFTWNVQMCGFYCHSNLPHSRSHLYAGNRRSRHGTQPCGAFALLEGDDENHR